MKIFITGGCGFIGSNIAKFHLDKKDRVVVYDNLSRNGTELNLKWLKSISKNLKFKFVNGDIRNFDLIKKHIKNSDVIYHMAGQVAVTTSIVNPREDFETNAFGTLNVLETMRIYANKAVLIYASTNKVYGNFDNKDFPKKGIDEYQLLDFHSPYGCSKGTGDQYVRDYGRVYNLKTVVLRQSCIYGSRQFGNEDQGWVIHFVRKIMNDEKLTIFGDGKQVRDILDVRDLINAYQLAIKKVKKGVPLVYNIGGGINNSISLLELIKLIEVKLNKKANLVFKKSREGDQQIYISDTSKISKDLGWSVKINKLMGVTDLIAWAKTI